MLDGASSIADLVAQAAADGAQAMALTDHDTIAGIIPFQRAALRAGIHPISGVELSMATGGRIVLLAKDADGFENICRLLTCAHQRDRLHPRVSDEELAAYTHGLIALTGGRFSDIAELLIAREHKRAEDRVRWYQSVFGASLYMALSRTSLPGDGLLVSFEVALANRTSMAVVATNDVHYAAPDDVCVHDVLVCMRVGATVEQMHVSRPLNSENDLKSGERMTSLFADHPEAIANTQRIALACSVVPPLNVSLFPKFSHDFEDESNEDLLTRLTWEGAQRRYGVVDDRLRARLHHELSIIAALGYVDYFLVVWDIARFAREQSIRYAGRGSAADSAVAYCLYITDVDAVARNLLFERFMSLERAEKPDIDIDFDSVRRDEVRQYVYDKYGEEHVGAVCTYNTFRGRSALREVGTVLGVPASLCDALAKRIPHMTHADRLERAFSHYPELRAMDIPVQRLQLLLRLAGKIAGFPRHFSTHVGGLVISSEPLLRVTSLQPSAKGVLILPYDKDAVEDVGLVKLDLLSLRTMHAIDGTISQIRHRDERFEYDAIPFEDPETFAMIRRGDTIGTFQLESPAQRALQSKLGATTLEDIVASVALIRPGPIQGNMVDPFLRRRRGQEPVTFLHPKLEDILAPTYGVVLFQEQVIQIATAIANFTPGEADQLRRVMSHARSAQEMERIGQDFVAKALQSGVDAVVAETIFSYMRSYASYGFCEAHAAAFAATAYKTAYLTQHYPAEMFASILNAQPMGYYPRHVLLAEVKRRGVQVLAVDVNESDVNCVGNGTVLRLGLLQVSGMRVAFASSIVDERLRHGRFLSLADFCNRVVPGDRLLIEQLIRIGAFASMHEERKGLLWELPALLYQREHPQGFPLTLGEHLGVDEFSRAEQIADEYRILGYGVSGHALSLVRPHLEALRCVTLHHVQHAEEGALVAVAGLVVRPHRPPTRSGKTVVFFGLEDETGMIDVTVFESVYQRCGAVLFHPNRSVILVRGVVQRRDGSSVQILAQSIVPYM